MKEIFVRSLFYIQQLYRSDTEEFTKIQRLLEEYHQDIIPMIHQSYTSETDALISYISTFRDIKQDYVDVSIYPTPHPNKPRRAQHKKKYMIGIASILVAGRLGFQINGTYQNSTKSDSSKEQPQYPKDQQDTTYIHPDSTLTVENSTSMIEQMPHLNQVVTSIENSKAQGETIEYAQHMVAQTTLTDDIQWNIDNQRIQSAWDMMSQLLYNTQRLKPTATDHIQFIQGIDKQLVTRLDKKSTSILGGGNNPEDATFIIADDYYDTELGTGWIIGQFQRHSETNVDIHLDLSKIESYEKLYTVIVHEGLHGKLWVSQFATRDEGLAELITCHVIESLLWEDNFWIWSDYQNHMVNVAMIWWVYSEYNSFELFVPKLRYQYKKAKKALSNQYGVVFYNLLSKYNNQQFHPHLVAFFCQWVGGLSIARNNPYMTQHGRAYITDLIETYPKSYFGTLEKSAHLTDTEKIQKALWYISDHMSELMGQSANDSPVGWSKTDFDHINPQAASHGAWENSVASDEGETTDSWHWETDNTTSWPGVDKDDNNGENKPETWENNTIPETLTQQIPDHGTDQKEGNPPKEIPYNPELEKWLKLKSFAIDTTLWGYRWDQIIQQIKQFRNKHGEEFNSLSISDEKHIDFLDETTEKIELVQRYGHSTELQKLIQQQMQKKLQAELRRIADSVYSAHHGFVVPEFHEWYQLIDSTLSTLVAQSIDNNMIGSQVDQLTNEYIYKIEQRRRIDNESMIYHVYNRSPEDVMEYITNQLQETVDQQIYQYTKEIIKSKIDTVWPWVSWCVSKLLEQWESLLHTPNYSILILGCIAILTILVLLLHKKSLSSDKEKYYDHRMSGLEHMIDKSIGKVQRKHVIAISVFYSVWLLTGLGLDLIPTSITDERKHAKLENLLQEAFDSYHIPEKLLQSMYDLSLKRMEHANSKTPQSDIKDTTHYLAIDQHFLNSVSTDILNAALSQAKSKGIYANPDELQTLLLTDSRLSIGLDDYLTKAQNGDLPLDFATFQKVAQSSLSIQFSHYSFLKYFYGVSLLRLLVYGILWTISQAKEIQKTKKKITFMMEELEAGRWAELIADPLGSNYYEVMAYVNSHIGWHNKTIQEMEDDMQTVDNRLPPDNNGLHSDQSKTDPIRHTCAHGQTHIIVNVTHSMIYHEDLDIGMIDKLFHTLTHCERLIQRGADIKLEFFVEWVPYSFDQIIFFSNVTLLKTSASLQEVESTRVADCKNALKQCIRQPLYTGSDYFPHEYATAQQSLQYDRTLIVGNKQDSQKLIDTLTSKGFNLADTHMLSL